MIKLNDVTKKVQDSDATSLTLLQDINLHIGAAESVAICGASGSGKSTLLAVMAGLEKVTKGQVYFQKQCLNELSEDALALLRLNHIGFIFQSFHLIPSLNALDNVLLPLDLAGRYDDDEIAMDLLKKVGLAKRWRHKPSQLSGGEQQRVAIARAFVSAPKVLFADEPTGNLDQRNSEMIEDLLFQSQQQNNATLILVTHDLKLAHKCKRQYHLDAGKLRIE